MADLTALDLTAFTTAELEALLTAAKARLLAKITGTVVNGGSSGQTFGMSEMTVQELQMLINALTAALGFPEPELRVRPNFNQTGGFFPR